MTAARRAPHAPAAGIESGRLRIAVVTNGSWFATVALDQLLSRIAPRHEIRVIVATGLRRQSGNRLVEAVRLLRRWGPRYFAYKAVVNFLPSAAARLTGRGMSMDLVARRLAIPLARHRNLNDPSPLAELRTFAPDLLVSFSCPNRLSATVLGVPRIGALNVHSSLLPAYAGMAGYVHSLVNNDRSTGVTVHEMVERLDAGRIVQQAAIDIEPGTSVFRLFLAQCLAGATLLETAIDAIAATGRIDGSPQDLGARSYVGEPTSRDIATLRRNGFRLIGPADLVELVRPRPPQPAAPSFGDGTVRRGSR